MLDFQRKMAVDGIPVVDFSAMSLENKNPLSEDAPSIRDLADQVYQAFSTIGFVYLRNHGIPQEMVGCLFITSDPLSPESSFLNFFLVWGIMWLNSLLYLLKLQPYLFSSCKRSLQAGFDIQACFFYEGVSAPTSPPPRLSILQLPVA